MTSGIYGLAHKHTLTVTTGMTCLFSAQRPSFCHFVPLLCHSCQFLVLLTFTILASSPHVLLLCFLVIGCMYSEAEYEEVPVFGLSDAVKCDFCQRGGSSKWKKRDLWKHISNPGQSGAHLQGDTRPHMLGGSLVSRWASSVLTHSQCSSEWDLMFEAPACDSPTGQPLIRAENWGANQESGGSRGPEKMRSKEVEAELI